MPGPISGATMMQQAAQERQALLEVAGEIARSEISWSPTIAALATDLALAQGEVEGVVKDASNPHFRSKYATLDAHWKAARKTLSEHGLSVIQLPYAAGRVAVIKTLLLHKSGEWIASALTLVGADDRAQTVCGLITYGRRYAFSAMVGTAPEDDDGNTGSTNAGPEGVKVDTAKTPVQRANAAAETARELPAASAPVVSAAPPVRPPAVAPPVVARPAPTAATTPAARAVSAPVGQVVTPPPPPGRPPARAPSAAAPPPPATETKP